MSTGVSTGAGELGGLLAQLEDQRDFLLRSIADAQREHDAGDLSDEDYTLLTERDERRLHLVDARIDELRETASAPSRGGAGGPGRPTQPEQEAAAQPRTRRRRSTVLGLLGAALFVVGAVLLVARAVTDGLPGQPITGSITLTQDQQIARQMAQAQQVLNQGDVSQATQLYADVLNEDPSNVAALSEEGYLNYATGVTAGEPAAIDIGRTLVERAIRLAPAYGPAHLFYGVMLDQGHQWNESVTQFRLFLSERPSKQNLERGAPYIRQAYDEAGVVVPPQVPAVGTGVPSAPGGH